MKRAFKTRNFARWMRKTELTEKVLRAAIVEKELDAHVESGAIQEIRNDDQA